MESPQYRRTVLKSLSIPLDYQIFLDENPDLSPSKMLQSKIREIMENRRINSSEIDRLRKVNLKLQHHLQEANENNVVFEKEGARLRGIQKTQS